MRWFTFFLMASCVVPVFATPLIDPDIPNGETATYRTIEQDEEWTFFERSFAIVEDELAAYRIEYTAPGERSTVYIDRQTMFPYASRNVSNGSDLTIESTTSVEIPETIETDAILLLSFNELKYLLRGYPFESAPAIDVEFFSTDEDDTGSRFNVHVRYRGTERIKIGDDEIETHKLELKFSASGVLRVLNALIPKTYYWYSVEPAHYLVAYEGSSGFPGSPKRRIEIVDYSGW